MAKCVEYVFVCNIMYNMRTIVRVRWWHKLFGFPGRIALSRHKSYSADHYRDAVETFRKQGRREGMN